VLLTVFEYFENHWRDFPWRIRAFFASPFIIFIIFLFVWNSQIGMFLIFNVGILTVLKRFSKFLTEKKYRFDVWVIFSYFMFIMFLTEDYEYKFIKDFINSFLN
jgi:hypothetical protein